MVNLDFRPLGEPYQCPWLNDQPPASVLYRDDLQRRTLVHHCLPEKLQVEIAFRHRFARSTGDHLPSKIIE
ncbi:MAG: hypothetical protein SX243_21255 [Acidobacteriota bacterium]|nr:hypothetical protein [Acidobacteriota bacterium]